MKKVYINEAINPVKIGDDRLMNIDELGMILQVKKSTLLNWISSGKIPSIKIGRKHFFKESTLLDWINEKEEIKS